MAEQRDDDKPVTPSESQTSGQIPPLDQTSATPQPSSDWPQPTTPASAINGVANGAADAAAANVSNGYPVSQVPPAFLQQPQPQTAAPQSPAVQMPPAQQSSASAYQVQGYQSMTPYAAMPQQSQTAQPSQAVPQPQQAAPQQYAATQQSMPHVQFPASYAQQQSQQYVARPQTMDGQPLTQQPFAPQSHISAPAQLAAAQQAQAVYPQQSLGTMQTQPQAALPQSATSPVFVSAPAPALNSASAAAPMPTDSGEVMLLGTYTPKIDAKGRMALPAKFRTQLGPGLIMARGQERCVYLFPQAEFRRVAMQIQHTSLGNKAAREYLRVLLSGAVDQTPDKQGRVLVPQMLRDYAKLGSDIVVIGVGTRAEIWDKKAWEQYLADNEQGYSDIADDVLPSVEW
ncbi:protein mraZ [Bifidobacterium thermophilum]|nr:protein mraZ [Bifidobacterium thermophilum]